VRFVSFMAWVIRHQLRPRSFRAHLTPLDLLALDALAVHCGSDALTSMDLRVGVHGHTCMPSMLVPDPNPELSTRIDLTHSTSSMTHQALWHMTHTEREARWQEATVRTIQQSLRHSLSASPTVASVLSRFTFLETLKVNVRVDIMGPAGLLEALRPLHRLHTLHVCLPTHDNYVARPRLALPDLPSLRELYIIGGLESFLKVASPTLRKLDCTAGGKYLRLHLECPLLQDLHLPDSLVPYGYGPFVVLFAGHFPCMYPHRCRESPQLCSTSGHTSCGCGKDRYNCRPFDRSYVVGESCKGLYSPEGDSYTGIVGPSVSGPGSLWRIPDGVRVTFGT
jgi:hypothetical protein